MTDGPLSDRAYQDRMNRYSRQLADRMRQDLRTVLSTEQGRRWVWELIYHPHFCGVGQAVFDHSRKYGISESMAHKDGRAEVGRLIEASIQDSWMELWELMNHEAFEQSRADRAQLEALKHRSAEEDHDDE